jgi:hypothetical protein
MMQHWTKNPYVKFINKAELILHYAKKNAIAKFHKCIQAMSKEIFLPIYFEIADKAIDSFDQRRNCARGA